MSKLRIFYIASLVIVGVFIIFMGIVYTKVVMIIAT